MRDMFFTNFWSKSSIFLTLRNSGQKFDIPMNNFVRLKTEKTLACSWLGKLERIRINVTCFNGHMDIKILNGDVFV